MSNNTRGQRTDKHGSEQNLVRRVRQSQEPGAYAGWGDKGWEQSELEIKDTRGRKPKK